MIAYTRYLLTHVHRGLGRGVSVGSENPLRFQYIHMYVCSYRIVGFFEVLTYQEVCTKNGNVGQLPKTNEVICPCKVIHHSSSCETTRIITSVIISLLKMF